MHVKISRRIPKKIEIECRISKQVDVKKNGMGKIKLKWHRERSRNAQTKNRTRGYKTS